eukprot:g31835.t1
MTSPALLNEQLLFARTQTNYRFRRGYEPYYVNSSSVTLSSTGEEDVDYETIHFSKGEWIQSIHCTLKVATQVDRVVKVAYGMLSFIGR